MKVLPKYILFTFVMLVISACGITKEYTKQDLQEFEQYRSGGNSEDSVTLASINWRDYFADDQLIAHIDTALKYNFDVLRAQQNLSIGKSLLKQSKANFFPGINANASTGISKPSTESFNGQNLPSGTDFQDWSLGVSYNWEIDVWGKLRSQKRAAAAQLFEAEHLAHLVQTEIINATAYYYYTLQALDQKKEIVEKAIINRQEGLETIRALKIAGSVTDVAVKQNEALLYQAQSLLIDVENQITLTENAFSLILGQVPGTIKRRPIAESNPTETYETGYPIQLLSNRPDILMSEFKLIKAFELTNVARASFYPTLSITGGAGLNSQNFSDLFNTNAIFANLIGGLVQPIFNRRQLKTQKEINLSEQEIAAINYKEIVLTGYQEVSNELNNLKALSQKLSIKKEEKNALNLSLEYSYKLQDQGLVNYLEILRAKDQVLNVELNLVDLQMNGNISKANLYKSLGGGWSY